MDFYIGFIIFAGLLVSVGVIIIVFDLWKFKNTGLIAEKETEKEPVVKFYETILQNQIELKAKIEKLEKDNEELEEKITSKISQSLQQAIRDFSVE